MNIIVKKELPWVVVNFNQSDSAILYESIYESDLLMILPLLNPTSVSLCPVLAPILYPSPVHISSKSCPITFPTLSLFYPHLHQVMSPLL